MNHSLKYIAADEPENIVEYRKAKYLRFIHHMTQYPPRLKFEQYKMPTDKESSIIWGCKNGLIPWFHPGQSPDEWMKEQKEKNVRAVESDSDFLRAKGPWSQYFYTNFFGNAPKLILKSKEEIKEKKKKLEEPIDTSSLPSDGSKGQAKENNKNNILTTRWFLGDWDGNYTDWKDKPKSSETYYYHVYQG